MTFDWGSLILASPFLLALGLTLYRVTLPSRLLARARARRRKIKAALRTEYIKVEAYSADRDSELLFRIGQNKVWKRAFEILVSRGQLTALDLERVIGPIDGDVPPIGALSVALEALRRSRLAGITIRPPRPDEYHITARGLAFAARFNIRGIRV